MYEFDYIEPQETLATQTALDSLLDGNCDSAQSEDDEQFFGVFDWFNYRD